MKTQEEIEKMANEFSKDYIKTTNNSILQSSFKLEVGYIKGYKQCQEDMALSQPKELEPQTEITSAELWQNRYESLLKGLNDITNELNVYKVNKDFDLDELKVNFIKTWGTDRGYKIWDWILPHLQKPVESDAVEFLEWIGNDWTKLKKGWMKSDLYTTIEATHTTAELYEQFKQLKKQDWSKIDITILAKKIAESYIKFKRKKHEEWKAYWHYELYTPIYLKIWHKLTFKKTPKY